MFELAQDEKILRETRRECRITTMAKWQDRWDHSSKVGYSYGILPDVTDRVKLKWLDIGYHCSVVDRTWKLQSKVFGFALVDSLDCIARGVLDAVDHVIHDCGNCTVVSVAEEQMTNAGGAGWCSRGWQCMWNLVVFVREAFTGVFQSMARMIRGAIKLAGHHISTRVLLEDELTPGPSVV
ncbi:hypothetical protein PR048_011611 [Dryococelus australis]|uniref:Uncharacterized protein n=1 Tax=Dryococelus australis TaxID=614101 RepID=A0ABQ9HMN9_9NEOP|nr:hypothetical protein PR048_011611 [Dryococelus australis]